MGAIEDAKTALEATITAGRALLDGQDEADSLRATVQALRAIHDAADEWTRASISLYAMTTESDADFDAAVGSDYMRDLRQLTQRLKDLVIDAERLVVALAIKARTPQVPPPGGVVDPEPA
jgi:hypothetical protein